MAKKLYGTDPDQVPTNADLGTIAYQDADNLGPLSTGGNVLVGTTNISPATDDVAGIKLSNTGAIQASVDGNAALFVNRKGVGDGTLVDFRHQGDQVGSIGTRASLLKIGSGDTGITFNPTNDSIFPEDMGGTFRDAAIDLGVDAARFKDLYLSGGVVFGDAGGSGTSSSNSLDSYEEGTFTPTAVGSAGGGSTSYGNQYGYYTKVGRLVSVTMFVSWTAMTDSGNMEIGGLPFTVANNTQHYPVATVMSSLLNWGGGSVLTGLGKINTTTIPLYYAGDDIAAALQAVVNEAANVRINMTYHTS